MNKYDQIDGLRATLLANDDRRKHELRSSLEFHTTILGRIAAIKQLTLELEGELMQVADDLRNALEKP